MTFPCRASAPVPYKVRIAVAARRRKLLCAAAVAASTAMVAAPAMAADWLDDTLRGSYNAAPVRWDGINLGATTGLSSMTTNYGSSTSSQVAYTLRNTTLETEQSPSSWTTLPESTSKSKQFGLFIGYNMQWQELVLGFDLAYNKVSGLSNSASDTMTRQVTLSDGTSDSVTIAAQGQTKLIDYATLRARAGYAYGQFMPYGILGVAVGRFNYSISTTVTVDQTPAGGATTRFAFPTTTDARDATFSAGPLFGIGMDVAVMPNVFLRAEWEYAAFAPIHGIRSRVSTGRIGIGLRF